MDHSLKGIIFDLDMTLVNTMALEAMRKRSRWNEVYSHFPATTVYPGINSMLRKFTGILQMGVVTSSPRVYAERILAYHHLPLPVLAAYHDTVRHKPDGEPIELGMRKLSMGAEQVIAIGDEVRDIISAQHVGVRVIAVGWGKTEKSRLLAEGPDYYVSTVSELETVLEAIRCKSR